MRKVTILVLFALVSLTCPGCSESPAQAKQPEMKTVQELWDESNARDAAKVEDEKMAAAMLPPMLGTSERRGEFPMEEWESKCEKPNQYRHWLDAWGTPKNHPACNKDCKRLRVWKVVQNRQTDRLVKLIVRQSRASNDLYKMLRLVYRRESFGGVPGLAHRLDADIEANEMSMKRMRPKFEEKGNDWASEPWKWRGLGLYGMNSPVFVPAWSWTAPPEVLCDSVVSTLVYMRKLRRTLNKLLQGRGIRCALRDDEGKKMRDPGGKLIRYTAHPSPTWYTLHRAVSGGTMCPAHPTNVNAAYYSKRFHIRAEWQKLDSDATVSMRQLGREPVPPSTTGNQYELVDHLWAEFKATQKSN